MAVRKCAQAAIETVTINSSESKMSEEEGPKASGENSSRGDDMQGESPCSGSNVEGYKNGEGGDEGGALLRSSRAAISAVRVRDST